MLFSASSGQFDIWPRSDSQDTLTLLVDLKSMVNYNLNTKAQLLKQL